MGDRLLVPQADPASWWGTRAVSRAPQPVRDPERPVPVSASMLDAVATCPTHWFLRAEAGGVAVAHQSANLGQIVHALAQRVADGDLPPDLDALIAEVDGIWDRLAFRTPWSKRREHDRVQAALARFLAWHAANPREVVGLETRFTAEIELDGGEGVQLAGYADRLEIDADGDVVVVDLKTARQAPSSPAVAGDRQLGLYQYAVEQGAFEADAPRRAPVGRSWSSSACSTGATRPRCRPRSRSATATPDDRLCAARWPAPRRTCAPRTSPPSPVSTAASAPSCRCVPSRAPGR